VSPEACRMLDRLLPVGALAGANPGLPKGVRIVSPNGTSFEGRFPGGHGFRGYSDHGVAVRRSVLDAMLAEAASSAGANLFEEATVESVGAVTAAGRSLRIRRGRARETFTARLVVGADGLHSRVAKQLGLARRGRLRRVALVTHATGVVGMGDLGEMHVGSSGYVGLAPVGNGVTNISLIVNAVHALGRPRDWFHRTLDGFPELVTRLRDAEFVTPLSGAGPFAHRTIRATHDRALLVGDAADFFDPFTGEGIYAALHGAELAVANVLRQLECDQLERRHLRPYDRARRNAFLGKWTVERILAWVVGHPAAFDHVAARLRAKPHLADLLVGVMGDFVPARHIFSPAFAGQLVL
jgi:menaquinone-9 beta-reductase